MDDCITTIVSGDSDAFQALVDEYMMRKQKHDTWNLPLTTLDTNPGSCKTPEDDCERLSQLSLLGKVIKQLPPTEQLLLNLVYEQELEPQQVALILHISTTAYYSRKSRILKKLKTPCKKVTHKTSIH